MQRLSTIGTRKTKVDDEIPVFTVTMNLDHTHEAEKEQEGIESYEKPTEQDFRPYLRKLYALADKLDESKALVPDLFGFIEAQSVDTDCRQAATFVGKPNSIIIHESDEGLVCVSPMDGTSKRF